MVLEESTPLGTPPLAVGHPASCWKARPLFLPPDKGGLRGVVGKEKGGFEDGPSLQDWVTAFGGTTKKEERRKEGSGPSTGTG